MSKDVYVYTIEMIHVFKSSVDKIYQNVTDPWWIIRDRKHEAAQKLNNCAGIESNAN